MIELAVVIMYVVGCLVNSFRADSFADMVYGWCVLTMLWTLWCKK